MSESEDEISAEELAQIVAEITGSEAKPLSAEQQAEHAQFMAERRARDERDRLERERVRAERAEEERSSIERANAIARVQRTKQLNDELREQSRRRADNQTLTSILNNQIEQRNFRQQALRAATNKAARDRLKNILNPPTPPEPLPEPEIPDDPNPPIGQGWPRIKSWWG